MNRKVLIFLVILFIGVFQIPFVKATLLEISNEIKNTFVSVKEKFVKNYEEFFEQKKLLDNLLKENQFLKDEIQKYAVRYAECKNLKYFKKIDFPNLTFVQTISYAKLPDFTEIYINYNKKFDHPLGLVYNNMAAGIVVKNYGSYSLALLNSNEKTTYAVYVGKNMIPGIFYGKIDTVKYIKKYADVKVGDEVITSGLDGIFYKGAKVGVVTEVIKNKLSQEVKVRLYYNDLNPEFFYVVRRKNAKH
jgi:rod shape-determining protein MreC